MTRAASPRSDEPEALRRALIALNADPKTSRRALQQWARAACEELRAEIPSAGQTTTRKRPRLPARWTDTARAEETAAHACGARVVTWLDDDYPPRLFDLEEPPPVLYWWGTLTSWQDRAGIGMVGSRRADAYGLEAARRFATAFTCRGLVVVSGFARGIDAACHHAAVECPGGETVAVLGCGLGVDYPRGQTRLAQQIAQHGAVITELPMRAPPETRHFPYRNRIIAALSFATLVVQAGERSGSLITARLAAELGRDVWAIPGRLTDALARGSNALLRDGALVALDPTEILESVPLAIKDQITATADVGPQNHVVRPSPGDFVSGELALQVLDRLEPGPLSVEALSLSLGAKIHDTLMALSELELRQCVVRQPGALFERTGPR